ncbi:MAG: cytochrome c [Myxococcota bacterium]|nr:cytochrome c [Myxococcota bacterium]
MKRNVVLALFVVSLMGIWVPASSQAAGDAAAGKALFDANCSSCHGVSGKGDGPVGAALTPPPRDFTIAAFAFDADQNGTPGEDQDLILVIQNGAMKYGGSPLMAPWPTLTEDQVTDVIAHIRSMKTDESAEPDEESDVESAEAPSTS